MDEKDKNLLTVRNVTIFAIIGFALLGLVSLAHAVPGGM